jgi:hypothetical protein
MAKGKPKNVRSFKEDLHENVIKVQVVSREITIGYDSPNSRFSRKGLVEPMDIPDASRNAGNS